jgi:hypothetical protein
VYRGEALAGSRREPGRTGRASPLVIGVIVGGHGVAGRVGALRGCGVACTRPAALALALDLTPGCCSRCCHRGRDPGPRCRVTSARASARPVLRCRARVGRRRLRRASGHRPGRGQVSLGARPAVIPDDPVMVAVPLRLSPHAMPGCRHPRTGGMSGYIGPVGIRSTSSSTSARRNSRTNSALHPAR